jgi:hypothetical protein
MRTWSAVGDEDDDAAAGNGVVEGARGGVGLEQDVLGPAHTAGESGDVHECQRGRMRCADVLQRRLGTDPLGGSGWAADAASRALIAGVLDRTSAGCVPAMCHTGVVR